MPHRFLVRALVAVGTLLGVLAIMSVWISRQALETDQWTDTSTQLLEDPAIQAAVSGYLVDQLYANTDVAGELRAALPPRAQPLATPAAAALRRAAEDITDRALDRPAVQKAWEVANRQAHQTLVKVVEGGGDKVSTSGGVVTLDLKVLLEDIAQRTGVGARAVDKLPASAASIEILRSDELSAVQTVGRLLKPLAALLVVLMLVAFGVAIALARDHRRVVLRSCGFGLVFAGIAALVLRSIGGGVVVDNLATTASVKPAVESVWRIGTSMLVGVASATIAYGALVVIGAWLAGPTRLATSLRHGLAPYLRNWRVTYGAVAVIVLLVLLWAPTEGTRRVLPALILTALLVAGVEALRRQAAREFPDAEPTLGKSTAAAVERARAAVAARRERPAAGAEAPAEDAVAQLEALTALHESGDLDDAEFTAAKQRVLTKA